MKDDLRKLENIGECRPRKQLNLGPKLPLFGWRRSVGPERNGLNATDLHPAVMMGASRHSFKFQSGTTKPMQRSRDAR